MLSGELISFKSINSVVNENEAVNITIEFFNFLDLLGLPLHNLQLKIGLPIILLRNIKAPQLYNKTLLVVKKVMRNIIESTIINSKFIGEHVLIPRIQMIPSDSPIQFKKFQFPFIYHSPKPSIQHKDN